MIKSQEVEVEEKLTFLDLSLSLGIKPHKEFSNSSNK
jgi:hypothetical protein